MKAMKPNASQSSRFASIVFLGLTVVLCAGMVLFAQHVQPQADKLPAPMPGTPNFGSVAPRPDGAELKVPAGFTVSVFADNITSPRYMAYAPNGDLFVSSFASSTITVFRDGKNLGIFAARGAIAAPGAAPAGGGAPRGPAPQAAGGGAPRGPGPQGGAPRGGARGPAPATALPAG